MYNGKDQITEDGESEVKVMADGTAASQHVPIEKASHMKIDALKEMLELTTARNAKRKLAISNKVQMIGSIKVYRTQTVIDELPPVVIITKSRAATQNTSNTTSR